jgi:hypothetical protein
VVEDFQKDIVGEYVDAQDCPLNLVIIQEEPEDDYHSPRPTLIDNNSHRHETCSLPSESLTASIGDKAIKDGYLTVAPGFRVSIRQNSD